jgi:hypothetical protein
VRVSFRLSASSRSFEVAPAPVAPRAPREDVRPELVGGNVGPLRDLERLVEKADRGLDAVQLEARDTEAEQHAAALDVGKRVALGERACALEQGDRLAHLAAAHSHRGLARQRADLELRQTGCEHGGADAFELGQGFVVTPGLEQRVSACECRVDATALVRGYTVCEKAGVHPELPRQPLDRLRRRARLPALDLTDVLLREAVAGELRLRQAGRHAQLPEPLAQPQPGLRSRERLLPAGGDRLRHVRRSRRHASPNFNPSFQASPRKVMPRAKTSQPSVLEIT